MEKILDIQEWTENWINDMHLAVKNKDVMLRDALLQEDVDSDIDWEVDAESLYEEYKGLFETMFLF